MSFSSISIVVPAYNEAGSILATVADMCAYFERKPYRFEIIVSADGNDGTRELVGALAAKDPRIKVIGHELRSGKGRGVREGFRIANGDIIGFVDADNKTPVSEFDKFERAFDEGAEVVIGSRAHRESRVERRQPLYRRLGSRVFGFGMHLVVGLNAIVDTQCGFKFFRRSAGRDVFQQQRIDGYMFDVEILHLATKAGYRIAQVPVRWRDDGDSRYQLVRGTTRNFIDLLRIRFGRLGGARSAVAAGDKVDNVEETSLTR